MEAEKINSTYKNRWEQIHISKGVARYDSENDHSAYDVVRRADKKMYDDKRRRKKALRGSEADSDVE